MVENNYIVSLTVRTGSDNYLKYYRLFLKKNIPEFSDDDKINITIGDIEYRGGVVKNIIFKENGIFSEIVIAFEMFLDPSRWNKQYKELK